MVARRCDLPDLSALLSGFQWRWHRRSQGHHRPAGAYCRSRCRCHLDFALLYLADEGLRLRRLELCRCRSDVRHTGRFRRADRGSPPSRRPRDDRSRHVAYLGPASMVRGKPRQPQQSEIGLVCLVGQQAGWHAAQQLAVDLRRLRLAVGSDPHAILHAQLPDLAAGPQSA
ncbi:hypothetical protein D3C80_1146010 [compost metagenome]